MARPQLFLAILLLAVGIKAQENAQTRIPRSLMECYQNHTLLQRDQRLPMTMNMLIELIRKVERDPAGNLMDMRQLTIALIHRFRLDGVVRAPGVAASSNVVPYSPQAFQFNKHKLILSNLIPGNAYTFPNNSLTPLERCSLHHMLSNTIELEARGDESTVCGRLSRYRTQRMPRQVRLPPNVETIDNIVTSEKKGNLIDDGDEEDRVNGDEVEIGLNVDQTNFNPDATERVYSQCPVENGVINSMWGHVSAGTMLAGLAAGLQPLLVNVGDLAQRMSPTDAPRNTQIQVDNKFAVTLAGDLAEVSLRQGPVKSSQQLYDVGGPGGWNSTQNPKWYFLTSSKDLEYTDAEIRGGLDGLILGTNIRDFQNRASSMKLSQLLDMYYSRRGVFTQKHRACNRKNQMTEVAPTERLKTQALGFSYVLDIVMQLPGTITNDGFTEYSSKATDSLNAYIPSKLNDLDCSVSFDGAPDTEIATDLTIVLESSWPYSFISNSLAYVLDNINVSPLGSNYTLMDGRGLNQIVNSTQSMSNFHAEYNNSVHQSLPMGFDLPLVLRELEAHFQRKLNREKDTNAGGGQSSIVLMVINSATISDSDINDARERLRIMREYQPDVRFLYLISGSRDRYNDLVVDPANDIITLQGSDDSIAIPQLKRLVNRISEFQRRLINPRCGSDWNNRDMGSTQRIEYVAPNEIKYYRIVPNYFYGLENSGTLKLQGHGFGSLNVCYSRTVERPRRSNSTVNNEGFECQSVTTNTIDLDMRNLCRDSNQINRCNPFYVSVEAVGAVPSFRCSERGCRYPDEVKYTFTMQDLGCFSGADRYIGSLLALLMSLVVVFKNFI